MHVEYISNKLKKTLKDERSIKKFYGAISEKLALRLSEIRIASNLEAIQTAPPPRRHKLTGEHEGRWGIDCSKNFRIILKPLGEFDINNTSSISSVMTVDILDYH